MASALPMPALPPVINTVLPVIFIGVSLNKSAIGEYRLAIYPRALIAAECGNDIGNIGGQADNPPTITNATGGFAQGIEAAFSVHRPHAVKRLIGQFTERTQMHDARIGYRDIHAAEFFFAGIEQ